MKPVPPEILASAPEGTLWYGGAVDRISVSLRVRADDGDVFLVSQLLGTASTGRGKGWSVSLEQQLDGDLDKAIGVLFSNLTGDMAVWSDVTSRWPTDVFVGLFMERDNRGVELSPETLRGLAKRGISIDFDIYAPDRPDVESLGVIAP